MDIKIVKSKSKKRFAVIAKLIMRFQKADYSHMSIHFRKPDGVWIVADVTGSDGFRCNNLGKWSEKHQIVESRLLRTTPSSSYFMTWMVKHLGVEYDQGQVFGLLLRALGLFTNNTMGHNYKKMTCNELVLSYAEEFLGAEIGDSDEYDLNMTWDIIEKCLS